MFEPLLCSRSHRFETITAKSASGRGRRSADRKETTADLQMLSGHVSPCREGRLK
jgi:hypothetical protein